MRGSLMLQLGLFVVLVSRCSSSLAETQHVADLARVRKRPLGSPRYSDVLFSSRWPRPVAHGDKHDTFEAAGQFHATRIEWNYPGTDVEFIRKTKARGYRYFGTINCELPDTPGGTQRLLGRDRTATGRPVGNPNLDFLQSRGDVASRAYRDIVLAHLKLLIDAGADGIHVDDPAMTYGNALTEGGGYGKASLEHFAKYLAEHTALEQRAAWGMPEKLDDFDYAAFVRSRKGNPPAAISKLFHAFHRETLDDFYTEIRRRIDEYAGRRVPFSCNNGSPQWQGFPYRDHFDYWIGETSVRYGNPTARRIYSKVREAASLGKAQYFSPLNDDSEHVPDRKTYVAITRRIIASSYACGSATIVPWDVWRLGTERFFGTVEEFGDIYRMVHRFPELFDDHEEVFAVGPDIEPQFAHGLKELVVCLAGASDKVLVTVRAVPKKANAAIVVHLVDWSENPEPFELFINNGLCGGSPNGTLEAELVLPGDKPDLLAGTIQDDGHTRFEVPRLSPYCLLVIGPQPLGEGEVP